MRPCVCQLQNPWDCPGVPLFTLRPFTKKVQCGDPLPKLHFLLHAHTLCLHSSALVSALSSPSRLLSAAHPTYLFLALAAVGVAWALLVRCLLLHSLKNHKTHYKLSENTRSLGGSGLANGMLQGPVVGGRERLKVEVQPLAFKTGALCHMPWRQILKSPPVV